MSKEEEEAKYRKEISRIDRQRNFEECLIFIVFPVVVLILVVIAYVIAKHHGL